MKQRSFLTVVWSVLAALVLAVALFLAGPTTSIGAQGTPRATLPIEATFAPTLTARANSGNTLRKVSPEKAAQALTNYAKEVLDIDVRVRDAAGLTANLRLDLTETLEILLEGWVDLEQVIGNFAVETYAGAITGGVATLGNGSAIGTGDVTAEVLASSFAIYSIFGRGAAVTDADAALKRGLEEFPGMKGLKFRPYKVSAGYAWYAESKAIAKDLVTGKDVIVPQRVLLYVGGRRNVQNATIVIGRGDFAEFITPR
jgi:hypothetical protein